MLRNIGLIPFCILAALFAIYLVSIGIGGLLVLLNFLL